MSVLDPLILPADVLIVPVAELPADVGGRIAYADGDCAVTRPRTRTTSTVVDARTAALLARFRAPSTIVDAVIAQAAADGSDPREALDAASAVLGAFVNDGLLVPPDSELARPIETTLAPGDQLGGFEVLETVHVVSEAAVHLARGGDGELVALKAARDGWEDAVRAQLDREAEILGGLDARVTPRLVGRSDTGGRPFVAMSWCPAVDATEAAGQARRLGGEAVVGLVGRVLEAYAHLHAQGVLHGDVHPGNVLVDRDGAITIVDFGLAAHFADAGTTAARLDGGVDAFAEPELAVARLRGGELPGRSAAGEQYAIGALVYQLLTGTETHRFALDASEMLRQIAEQPPAAFAVHGARHLPAVERVVARALAKRPGDRHESVAALLAAFRAAAPGDLAAAGEPASAGGAAAARRRGPATRLLDDVLERLVVPGGELDRTGLVAPTASVQNGAAGFAYALLRVAGVRADAGLLAQADLWSERALVDCAGPGGLRSDELGIGPDTVGACSLHHAAPGVHAVSGLVARARGDRWAQQSALDAFVATAGAPGRDLDVSFGRAGLLLGAAALVEASAPELSSEPVRRLGRMLHDGIVADLDAEPELAVAVGARAGGLRSLGAAHGWAGVLFALLRWDEATRSAPDGSVGERLVQLAGLGRPVGRGTRWPHAVGESPSENPLAASWCNGAAGYVALWTLAHRLTGDDVFSGLARAAAWTAYEDPSVVGNLCCGLGGRAYALLNVYRHGGGDAWLARARELADRAAVGVRDDGVRRDSLYNGDVGVAVLAADLEDPLHACMPLFETEGWPRS